MDKIDLIDKWQKLYKLYENNKTDKILRDGLSVENALGYKDGPCQYSYFHMQKKLILAQNQLKESSYSGPPKSVT